MLMPALVVATLTLEHTQLGSVQRFGNGSEEILVPVRHALLYQGRKAADEVHSHFLCRFIQRHGKGRIVPLPRRTPQ